MAVASLARHAFRWLGNILLYGCTTFCLSIHGLMDGTKICFKLKKIFFLILFFLNLSSLSFELLDYPH